jgi:hypothetical protein
LGGWWGDRSRPGPARPAVRDWPTPAGPLGAFPCAACGPGRTGLGPCGRAGRAIAATPGRPIRVSCRRTDAAPMRRQCEDNPPLDDYGRARPGPARPCGPRCRPPLPRRTRRPPQQPRSGLAVRAGSARSRLRRRVRCRAARSVWRPGTQRGQPVLPHPRWFSARAHPDGCASTITLLARVVVVW